jgi:hypothetical protein
MKSKLFVFLSFLLALSMLIASCTTPPPAPAGADHGGDPLRNPQRLRLRKSWIP